MSEDESLAEEEDPTLTKKWSDAIYKRQPKRMEKNLGRKKSPKKKRVKNKDSSKMVLKT